MWFCRAKNTKDGSSRFENAQTQPMRSYAVFNNPEVLTLGWYPVAPSNALIRRKTLSWKLGRQRLVVYRGADGIVRAMDAFCPHMGADLATGTVIANELQCYFHRWTFNGEGELTNIPCRKQGAMPKIKNEAYPVEEKYGWLWVYSGPVAPYPVPVPPGLEGEDVVAKKLGQATLFAHHHVLMVNGIDVQHFASVHNLDIDFQLTTREHHAHVFDWDMSGELPSDDRGWRVRLARKLVGPRVGYIARFAGGSIVTLTYNPEGTTFNLFGFKLRVPPLHIFWGCTPLESGVSKVDVFCVFKKRTGVFGRLANALLFLTTLVLLVVLRDDDVQAFPGMRFNPGYLLPIDGSVAKLIQRLNALPVSKWSRSQQQAAKPALGVPYEHPTANA